MGVYRAFVQRLDGTLYARSDAPAMRIPITRDAALRFGRFVLLVEGISLLAAAILGGILAVVTRRPILDSFFLATFVIFLLFLMYAVLSGPGFFLSRPRFAPIGPKAEGRWRTWLAAPAIGTDRELLDLVLYTALAFLLLAIATGIGALVEALRG